MAVSKASRFFSFTLFCSAIWLFWCLKVDFLPKELHLLVYGFPVIVAAVFGFFAATNIAYHMLTFKECPKAYEELMKDVKEAKAELAKKGIKVQ